MTRVYEPQEMLEILKEYVEHYPHKNVKAYERAKKLLDYYIQYEYDDEKDTGAYYTDSSKSKTKVAGEFLDMIYQFRDRSIMA